MTMTAADRRMKIEAFREKLRQLDRDSQLLRELLCMGIDSSDVGDIYDHMEQIHFKLTDCKGQLGAVSHVLKKYEDSDEQSR